MTPVRYFCSACGTGPGLLRRLLLGLSAAVALTSHADDSRELWRSVSRVRGIMEIEHRSWIREPNGSPPTFAETTDLCVVRFVMVQERLHHSENLIWHAVETELTGTKRRTESVERYGNNTAAGQFRSPARDPQEFRLSMTSDGKWEIVSPQFIQTPFDYVIVYTGKDAGTLTETHNSVQSARIVGNIPKKIGPLTGRYADAGKLAGKDTRGFTKTATVRLWPEFDDVEVEVAIDDYADWVPRGNLAGPQSPGNFLKVRAVLKPKPPATKVLAEAKLFRFELAEVTREPGVALNWPLNATDNHPDLQFVAQPDVQLGAENLTAQVPPLKNREERDEATVRLAAHDFGAAGELRVICALTDGREVGGYLSHDGRRLAPIPLPYRRDDTRIAEKWRREWKVSGSDAADDDAEPVGNGATGDGFSHYEEYRGFAVGGLHLRTNPARKDFFVHNAIGRKAIAGLAHFATITKLTTHFELRRNELPESRRMNYNRSAKSPRSTEEFQHAVVLDDKAEGEASETVSTGAVARPKTTQRVSVHPLLFTPGRKPHEAESAIAHELLHSIGVKEHGDADRDVVWIRREGGEHPGVWLEERPAGWSESQGRMVYSDNPGVRIRLINSAGLEVPPEGLALFEEPVILYLGEHQGKHSGVVDCVIRYDCAKAFRVPDRARDRFLKEIEPVGMGLCNSATGTEFNAPGLPLVRYGNAQRGNCQQHFCVRDDAPDPGGKP